MLGRLTPLLAPGARDPAVQAPTTPPPAPLEGWLGSHGFDWFDILVLAVNVLLFVFATHIVRASRTVTDDSAQQRVRILRIANLVLFLLYFVAYFVSDLARPLAQTGLAVLLGFLAGHFANVLGVHRYGREREIEGVVHRTDTYHSQLFSIIAIGLVVIVCGLAIINIWGQNHLLQATSVLGAIAVSLYATKDSWLPDNMAALILLHDGDLAPGAVVRCTELGLLGIVLRTTLTRTVFKDLVERHEIAVPNRRLRTALLEILSRGPGAGLVQSADFKVGYAVDPDAVKQMLVAAWQLAAKEEKAINAEREPAVRVVANADHAVVWRLFYGVGNVYRMMPAQFAIEEAALRISREHGIELATRLTHDVLVANEDSAMPLRRHESTPTAS